MLIIKTLIKKLFKRKKSTQSSLVDPKAIIAREDHKLSRQNINQNALKVLYRLKKRGYEAFLVGGGVRDLLLGHTPKDFDIVTDATPNEVKKCFRNCRLIGRRFRLAHIHFGREIVEVATFRGKSEQAKTKLGMITRDNTFGTLEEDTWRRDLSINALYYNIADYSIIDLTGGIKDLQAKLIRILGEAKNRYTEDPVRMLRVVRLAAKLDFHIEEKTAAPIQAMAELLSEISNARLFDETLKLFHKGAAKKTFEMLHDYHLLKELFPATARCLDHNEHAKTFIHLALENTDTRINEGKTVTPAFLYAVFLWYPLNEKVAELTSMDIPAYQAHSTASGQIINQQIKYTAIPKRFTNAVREIWHMQHKLTRKLDSRAYKLVHHGRFRAAYDFLLLRSHVEPELQERAQFWTEFQTLDNAGKKALLKEHA